MVYITVENIRKMLETFTLEQLLDILQEAATKHMDVLDSEVICLHISVLI